MPAYFQKQPWEVNHRTDLASTYPGIYMVQGGGFEPPKLARQIYSLIPLATREPLRVLIIVACCSADAMSETEIPKLELARGIEPPTG